jgi:hypothetical protein
MGLERQRLVIATGFRTRGDPGLPAPRFLYRGGVIDSKKDKVRIPSGH